MDSAQSALGLFAFCLIAWAFGREKGAAPLRIASGGLIVQMVLALALLKLPPAKAMFLALNDAVVALEKATRAGTSLVFGYLGGGPLPFAESFPGSSFVLAFQALPLVLVVSALSALLYHWRVLPLIVRAFAFLLEKGMGVRGPVGVSAAANVFVGMVEAPLIIRPYLMRLTASELFVVMSVGMAGIAGTVMVLYAAFLANAVPDALGHILIASIVSVPAAITVSRLMMPETGAETKGPSELPPSGASGAMDALTRGAFEGIQLLIAIVALLVVFVALVSLLNQALGLLPDAGGQPLTLQRMLGWIMTPLCWLAGLSWEEAKIAGTLMGTKTVLNELVAYLELSKLPPEALSERSRLIMLYALCGFANFGSLGIMIGGMGAMAPERRDEIVRLGMKSIVAGTLATLMTGAVVGFLT